MEAIKVKGLVKNYKDFRAVDGISFSVEEGSLFALLGENGAGKSTTINILCTILERTDGDVEICGYKLDKEEDEIRKQIGIVFQSSVLDGKLTVKENLYTRGAYYGLSKKEIEERLAPFSEKFEMEEIWDRKYEKLSGGQRRRVDIMRALINQPKILFLDEPTTGLDPKSRKLVWDYIDYLRREKGMTIFLTTHYMEETRDADQVVILDKGKIIATGTPAELKSRYACSRLVWYCDESKENDVFLDSISRKNIEGSEEKHSMNTKDANGDDKHSKADIRIRNYVYDVDHYTIRYEGNVASFLYEQRDKIQDFEVIKGSMDDVFLALTGRRIAE